MKITRKQKEQDNIEASSKISCVRSKKGFDKLCDLLDGAANGPIITQNELIEELIKIDADASDVLSKFKN